jgi:hypothetical protein
VNGERVGEQWSNYRLARAFADGFAEGSLGVEPEVIDTQRMGTWSAGPTDNERRLGFVTGEKMARAGKLGPAAARVLALREHDHRVLYAALVRRLSDDGRKKTAAKLALVFPDAQTLSCTDDVNTLARALVARLRAEGSVELARAVDAVLRVSAPPGPGGAP